MKKTISLLLCLMLMLGTVSVAVAAEEDAPFTISGAFGNDMVLQRDAEVKVWGWSDKKGEKITVSFKGNTVEGTVDNDGNWLVKLPKMAADKQENTLTATMGDYTVSLTGILVGDVYLVGGQSNAEKTLGSCGSLYPTKVIDEYLNATPNMIRYFYQTKTDATAVPEKMNTPQENTVGKRAWKKETRTTARGFSAIGFFFAHKVAQEADIPVGVIMVASNGSPVSQLMSKEASQKVNYTRYENNIPVSGMYNVLMNPFINMSIKGMIFYQGESENGLALTDYGKYNEYVNTYVEDLREKMGQDFPFYYVQLSSHVVDQWTGVAEQRAVQFDGLSVIKNSGMVVSMDQGFRSTDSDFAHPNYKLPVGERLGALALARDYGIGDESYVTSPMPKYAYKTDEGIVIKFQNVGDGLKRIGQHETLSGFKLIMGAKSYTNVEASIISTDEVLLTTKLSGIEGVGYGLELLAFADYPEGKGDLTYVANLGNSNDLPAPTFKLQKIYDSLDAAKLDNGEASAATPTPEAADQTPGNQAGDATDNQAGNAAVTATANIDNTNNGNNNGSGTGIIIGIVAGVVVIAAVAVVVIVIKKKKN